MVLSDRPFLRVIISDLRVYMIKEARAFFRCPKSETLLFSAQSYSILGRINEAKRTQQLSTQQSR